MPTDVLLLGREAEEFRAHLAPDYPALRFHVAADAAGITPAATAAEVLISVAPGVTPQVVRALPRLRWVQAATTGVDNLLMMPDLPPDVAITRVHGIHGPQMSELAMLDMLLLVREFPRVLRNQADHRWDRWPQRLLQGRTVAILGVGSIGEHLAPRCKAFGMTVLGVSERAAVPPGFDAILPRAGLLDAAARADVLVLLIPYVPATHHMVDAAVLAALPRPAWLVNLARGPVLDEAALVAALREGRLAGAALDVFAEEPLPATSPLWDVPNLIITPHIGGMSDTYVRQTLPTVRRNLTAFLAADHGAMEHRVARSSRS